MLILFIYHIWLQKEYFQHANFYHRIFKFKKMFCEVIQKLICEKAECSFQLRASTICFARILLSNENFLHTDLMRGDVAKE